MVGHMYLFAGRAGSNSKDFPRAFWSGQGDEAGEGLLDHVAGSPALDSAERLDGFAYCIDVVMDLIPLVAGEAHLLAAPGEIDCSRAVVRLAIICVWQAVVSEWDVRRDYRTRAAKAAYLVDDITDGALVRDFESAMPAAVQTWAAKGPA
jgi:hypothetical protein